MSSPSSPSPSSSLSSAYSLERFLMLYCFPVQMVIGLAGNTLNLIVLLNHRMRSNTNTLLAMVALADVLFLLAMFPHTLQFVRHSAIRQFVRQANSHITAMVNACAFASAWLVVAVSVERMTAVRWPLRARCFWTRANLSRLVLVIWTLCLLSSAHFHFSHSVHIVPRNETAELAETAQNWTTERNSGRNGTRSIQKVSLRPGWERQWRVLTTLNVFFGVLSPVVLVLLASGAMLSSLRRPSAAPSGAALLLPRPSAGHLRRARRATLHVLVIASAFAACQSPSALVHLWEVCWPPAGQLPAFRTLAVLSNSLVVTGKMANHFLLCLWSAHFRRSVRMVLSELCGRGRGRKATVEITDQMMVMVEGKGGGGSRGGAEEDEMGGRPEERKKDEEEDEEGGMGRGGRKGVAEVGSGRGVGWTRKGWEWIIRQMFGGKKRCKTGKREVPEGRQRIWTTTRKTDAGRMI